MRPANPLPWPPRGAPATSFGCADDVGRPCDADVQVCEAIREWEYGDYEGIPSPEIRKIRADQGLGGSWDIWKDGCPGGE